MHEDGPHPTWVNKWVVIREWRTRTGKVRRLGLGPFDTPHAASGKLRMANDAREMGDYSSDSNFYMVKIRVPR